MRVAVPIADGRISPLFDAARRLLVVNVKNECEVRRTEDVLEESGLAARARRVAELGADVLICAAISRPLEALLLSTGVEVVPQRCGAVEDVLEAFISGQLTEQAFVIPGCGGRRRSPGGRSHDEPAG